MLGPIKHGSILFHEIVVYSLFVYHVQFFYWNSIFILLDLVPPVDLGIRVSALGPQLYRLPLGVLQPSPSPVDEESVDVDTRKGEESASTTIEVWLSKFPSVLSGLSTPVPHGEKTLMKTAWLQLYTYIGHDM